MKAVIMAGGRGTRLRPLTCHVPKPMVPLLGRPCMEYIIDLLKRHGITEIAVTVQYMPQVIRNHFGDGSEFGVRLHYFEETFPLGTAGSVKNCQSFLDETFLVISGDALTDYDLSTAVAFHRAKQAAATLVLTRVEVPLEYGVVMVQEDGQVIRFLEKPSWSEVFSDTVNTGIYVLEPETLAMVPEDQEYDFSKALFPAMIGSQMKLCGFVTEGYWSDIGNLTQYRQTQFDMLNQRVTMNISGTQIAPHVWAGNDVQIHPDALIHGPAYIGDGTVIGPGAKIGPNVVVGRYNHLSSQAVLERTTVWNRNHIGRSAQLVGSTLCGGIQIEAGVEVGEDAVIGDRSKIGELAIIKPGVKIWPDKQIGPRVVQQSSLIWGKSAFQSLFDEDGISGIANLELVPEIISKIAAAYGSCLRRGATVSVSCDEYPYSGILKYAVISSLLAIGLQVRDVGTVLAPVARYEVRTSNSEGAVHIRKSGIGEDKRMVIQFFDQDGLPIDKATERKIENAFLQEDFSRPDTKLLGELEQTGKIVDFYFWELLSQIRVERVQSRAFKVVFHCASPQVVSLMQPLLEQLGCRVIMLFEVSDDLSLAVVDNRADIGIELDQSGQQFVFYTESGKMLTPEQVLILQMLIAVKERVPIAVPVTAPSVVEELSESAGIPVVRTKTILRSVLEVGRANPLQVHYDGFYSVVSLLQFLAEEEMSLQTVIDQLPQFHMNTEMVACPIEAKGRVMRRLMEDVKGQRLELIDGIKVLNDEGWALILPDAEKAHFRVVAQGTTERKARELTDLYKTKITDYQQSG